MNSISVYTQWVLAKKDTTRFIVKKCLYILMAINSVLSFTPVRVFLCFRGWGNFSNMKLTGDLNEKIHPKTK